jgi:DNA-binding CsgD family transcriptional regulator
VAVSLMGQGGDVARARRLFDEGIDAAAASGDTWGLIGAYAWRSVFAAGLGQEALAAHDFGRTLSGAAELGSTVMACTALYGLGRTAARRRHWLLAAQLFGAARTTSDAIGSTAARDGGRSTAGLLEEARAVLGLAAFEAAWSAGRGLSFDDAVALGCRAAEALAVADPTAKPSDARPATLTDREWEVARLVAEGRSNKQIAADLHLSVRTVENHLSHVYAKLGLGGRAELIVFVLRHAHSPA